MRDENVGVQYKVQLLQCVCVCVCVCAWCVRVVCVCVCCVRVYKKLCVRVGGLSNRKWQ